MAEENITQRAYTLRLHGTKKDDNAWRDCLWKTHEAVSKGAKVFGDWLLTMRGGLNHQLAEEEIPQKAKAPRKPTPDEIRDRRIVLALSWLSVESKRGAPEKYVVADPPAALREILKLRGVSGEDTDLWLKDCSASLSTSTKIRDDAVWVNRSAAFDDAKVKWGSFFSRRDSINVITEFWGGSLEYLAPEVIAENESKTTDTDHTDSTTSGATDENFSNLARGWLSNNWGTGTKSDNSQICKMLDVMQQDGLNDLIGKTGTEVAAYMVRLLGGQSLPGEDDFETIRKLVGWKTGRQSKGRLALESLRNSKGVSAEDIATLKRKFKEEAQEKKQKSQKNIPLWMSNLQAFIEGEIGMKFIISRNLIGEFAVMLDHAARRVSLAHTWIKRAEAERRQFEDDARKIGSVSPAAVECLDELCRLRGGTSGALEGFRIRKRAVSGWKEVLAAWDNPTCRTIADRIAAARAQQEEIEKFGDIQLFEALADEAYKCVWEQDGKPNPKPLLDYAAAAEAEDKKRRFKVPAYRHPDALRHPVFCDFGNSRWDISFAVHQAVKQLDKRKQAAEKRIKEAQKALEKAAKATTPEKIKSAQENLHEAQASQMEAEKEVAWLRDARGLRLKLWNGATVSETELRWQSKRLRHDLSLSATRNNAEAKPVSRADRLGRAAANVEPKNSVGVTGVFDDEYWNGRLQVPRVRLDELAQYLDKNAGAWDEKAVRLRNQLPWLVCFTAKLRTQGPWQEYAERNALKQNPKYWPHSEINKKRAGKAKLILSRLPGLRVLSVDLGHRYAAACAVWETITDEQMKKACQEAGVEAPKPDAMYCHIKRKTDKKNKKGKAVVETVIYRRTGPDVLGGPGASLASADETNNQNGRDARSPVTHPAPWARLDRQFLVKLQGEEHHARKATNEEWEFVKRLESELGREHLAPRIFSDHRVDELMLKAVNLARLALGRHGNRARIAFALTADYKPSPGDRRYYFNEAKDASARDNETSRREKQIEYLQDVLVMWHGLFSAKNWNDPYAKELWEEHVAKLPGFQAPAEASEDATGISRKKVREENRNKLRSAAEALLKDEPLRKKLNQLWLERWTQDDGKQATVDNNGKRLSAGTGWHERLRRLKDWILPRQASWKKNKKEHRQVGGLGLTRLAAIQEFRRKVQVAFFTRLRPDGKKDETGKNFGQNALDALETMRENRVKQLASRLTEAALGVGSENRKHWTGGKRPQARIADPRFAPCHAVVIENLKDYKPDETRDRRENRLLAAWRVAEVEKYLTEACELHGLHLRKVSAKYTSRQDSRTGAPGMRCQDVPVKEFMKWKKSEEKNAGEKSKYIAVLRRKWEGKSEDDVKKAPPLRLPVRGGEVFVSADAASPAAKGLQADLNAAANIGLKALLDPDWPGAWWYVPCVTVHAPSPLVGEGWGGGEPAMLKSTPTISSPIEGEGKNGNNRERLLPCEPTTFVPKQEAVAGSTAVPKTSLPVVAEKTAEAKKKKGTSSEGGKAVNLWHDISAKHLAERKWQKFDKYWLDVEKRVVANLRECDFLKTSTPF